MILNKELMQKILLFKNMTDTDFVCLESFLQPYTRFFRTDEYIAHAGDFLHTIGIILTGSVLMVSEDFWGNQNLISRFTAGEFFGEAHSFSRNALFFSLKTAEETSILFFNTTSLLSDPLPENESVQKLLHNLLTVIIEKKLNYMRKTEILSHRNLRSKISAYLTEEYRKCGAYSFTIPFNRQEMADYLSVDRCALSRELSKMKKEGILRYEHNHFTLLSPSLEK